MPKTSSAQLAFAGEKLCSLEDKKLSLVLGCTQMSEVRCETAEQPRQGSFPLSPFLYAYWDFLVP